MESRLAEYQRKKNARNAGDKSINPSQWVRATALTAWDTAFGWPTDVPDFQKVCFLLPSKSEINNRKEIRKMVFEPGRQ